MTNTIFRYSILELLVFLLFLFCNSNSRNSFVSSVEAHGQSVLLPGEINFDSENSVDASTSDKIKQRSLREALQEHGVSHTVVKVTFSNNEYLFDNFIISDLKTDDSLFDSGFQHLIYHHHTSEFYSGEDNFNCILVGNLYFMDKKNHTNIFSIRAGRHHVHRSKIGLAKLNTCNNIFSATLDISKSVIIEGISYVGDYNLHNLGQVDEAKIHSFSATFHKNGELQEHWSCGAHGINDDEAIHEYETIFSELNRNKDEVSILDGKPNQNPNRLRSLSSFGVSEQSKDKYVKLLVVNDYARFLQTGKNTHAMGAQLIQRLQTLYNKLNEKFRLLYGDNAYQIFISISGMVTFQHGDPWQSAFKKGEDNAMRVDSNKNVYSSVSGYEGEIDSHTLLSLFNDWREHQSKDRRFPDHTVGHLISGNDFVGDTVGLANLFAACRNQISSAVNQAKGFQDETVATIMAHELAHNLGVYHTDKTFTGTLVSSPCGGFIMDANGIRKTEWSKCTINYLKMFFEGYPYDCSGSDCIYARRYGASNTQACLDTKPSKVWSLTSVCGNGLKEPGEQCDCGKADCSKVDPCCDGRTCTFARDEYECSSFDPCCDKDKCTILPKEKVLKVCRESKGVCDQAEHCDGQQASCPFDDFLSTGTICYDAESDATGSCYAGNCNSHKAQCLEYSYLGFDGPCVGKDGDDGNSSCGDLYCHMKGTQANACYRVEQSGSDDQYVNVLDGTSCGVSGSSQNAQLNSVLGINEFILNRQAVSLVSLVGQSGLQRVCDSSLGKCVEPTELKVPAHITCSNGMIDTGETDVDCGGPLCSPCLPGEKCLNHSDCFNLDCFNSSYTYTSVTEESRNEYENSNSGGKYVSYPGGCTALRNESSCSEWSGCIWLEEFTRCKTHNDYPATGVCYSQKKRQSCINYAKCDWSYEGEKCFEIVSEKPRLGRCSGSFIIGAYEKDSWFDEFVDKLKSFFNDNSVLAYIVLGCFAFSCLLCTYSLITCISSVCCLSAAKKKPLNKDLKKRSVKNINQSSSTSVNTHESKQSSKNQRTDAVLLSNKPPIFTAIPVKNNLSDGDAIPMASVVATNLNPTNKVISFTTPAMKSNLFASGQDTNHLKVNSFTSTQSTDSSLADRIPINSPLEQKPKEPPTVALSKNTESNINISAPKESPRLSKTININYKSTNGISINKSPSFGSAVSTFSGASKPTIKQNNSLNLAVGSHIPEPAELNGEKLKTESFLQSGERKAPNRTNTPVKFRMPRSSLFNSPSFNATEVNSEPKSHISSNLFSENNQMEIKSPTLSPDFRVERKK